MWTTAQQARLKEVGDELNSIIVGKKADALDFYRTPVPQKPQRRSGPVTDPAFEPPESSRHEQLRQPQRI